MTKRFVHLCCAAVAATLLTIGAAHAAVATVQLTLDVSDLTPGKDGFTGGARGTPPFAAPFSVTLAEGDTLDMTIDFVGNQTVTINDLSFIWAFSFASASSDVSGTGTFTFLDTAGAPVLMSQSKTDTEGSVHFGQQFIASDFTGGLPSSITFGGLHYVGVLNDYLTPGVTSATYNDPALYFNARSFTTDTPPGTVSEPGGALLAALGFGALVRRRRASAR